MSFYINLVCPACLSTKMVLLYFFFLPLLYFTSLFFMLYIILAFKMVAKKKKIHFFVCYCKVSRRSRLKWKEKWCMSVGSIHTERKKDLFKI